MHFEHFKGEISASEKERIRASDLYAKGDTILVWVNEGELYMTALHAATITAQAQEIERLEGALGEIASQKTVNELCAEFGKEYETDWEGGYDQCIATARATLSPAKETP